MTSVNGAVANGHQMESPEHKKAKGAPEASQFEKFDAMFTVLNDELTKQGLKDPEIADAMAWFKRVNAYNVPFGKKNRGMAVVDTYLHLVNSPSDEELVPVRVVGWCIEWLQAFFLVADDVMDHSLTRRGQPCWYKVPGVSLEAINDSFYLESAIYILLKKYCGGKGYYVKLLELFHEVTMQTITGQCLDMKTAPEDHVDFSSYTLDRYKAIVKYKTAFYSFYLPVAAAMFMAGIEDEGSHCDAKIILLKMGEFFQIQDDYLDCYGDPKVTGKVGTDVEDNKCGWLIVQALHRATPEQRKTLEDNYAQTDPEKVAVVKGIYNDMNLKKVYADYEESSYQELCQLIEKLSGSLPKDIFFKFAQKIYKRQK